MNKVLDLIDGNKSYITALAIAVVVFLDQADILPVEQSITVLGLLGAGSVAAIRHAIQKLETKIAQ